jgi:hypothetical protein
MEPIRVFQGFLDAMKVENRIHYAQNDIVQLKKIRLELHVHFRSIMAGAKTISNRVVR